MALASKRKDEGFISAPSPSARKRLKQHQEAIKNTTRGSWWPAPTIHEYGDEFICELIGVREKTLKNKKGSETLAYQLVYKYVADPDDDQAMKCDGREWGGRNYRLQVYKDKTTGEERCIDFAYLKAYASMLSGDEVTDGEEALSTIIEHAKDHPTVIVKITARTNDGREYQEEEIVRLAKSTESSSSDEDDDAEPAEDEDADNSNDEGEDADEEEAPPPPKKRK